MHWYYDSEGTAEGPQDDEAMADLVEQGKISTETLVWQPDMERWTEVSALGPSWAEPRKKVSRAKAAHWRGCPSKGCFER
jgi:hypothetical protein